MGKNFNKGIDKYDFRTCIVEKDPNIEYWGNWKHWNVLYKTLAYEISSYKDVERDEYVREQIFKCFKNYKQYVGEEASLDIMNGWWFCFKKLFNIKTGRQNSLTKKFISDMMEEINNVNDKEKLVEIIFKKYGIDKSVLKVFLEYLEVVYTIGNITPVPKGGNVRADDFDSWEYKLYISEKVKYKGSNYMEYFYFLEYDEKDADWYNKWKDAKSKNDKMGVICNFMESRIVYIKNRGKEIAERNS